jgi:uncharacterized protein YecE (DUF72 family)
MGSIRIGTSGWHYKHWLGCFYPEKFPPKQMLSFYVQHFDTVELNNSFYHLPKTTSFDAWRETTPPGFLFAVKGSRFITHMKKLKDPVSSSEKFFAAAEHLHEKLGPILFQLPPYWQLNIERLEQFLTEIPKGHQYVFEFRDATWHVPEVYKLLRQHNAAFCIYDFSNNPSPVEITADFTYIRFHGANYSGSYSDEQLRYWAGRIQQWRKGLRDVYVYFNNDIGGHAIENAKELRRLVSV